MNLNANRLITKSPAEGLQVTITALKSLVADYSLRARQAEEMANLCLADKIPKEAFEALVVNKIREHMEVRGLDRSTHYLGIIQTTLMSLTNMHKELPKLETEQLEAELVTIIKALTIAINPT
jgi:hypothetical protein